MSSVGRSTAAVKRLVDQLGSKFVPSELRANWVASVASVAEESGDGDRLRRDRTVIVPWLRRTRPLSGARICEIGCGNGLAALTLAEQGALVTGLDIDPVAVRAAEDRFRRHGLNASFAVGNAAELSHSLANRSFDWIVFWATLEHMTLDERLTSLTAAWNMLPSGGLLTIIETPNRLWFFDSHTSRLPFFMWLPDELAYRTSRDSDRSDFSDWYTDAELAHLDEFRRRGRGVSFHELDVAIGRDGRRAVLSCLQEDRRRMNPLRRAAWRVSRAGRYESLLSSAAPELERCYLQPMLYITLLKP